MDKNLSLTSVNLFLDFSQDRVGPAFSLRSQACEWATFGNQKIEEIQQDGGVRGSHRPRVGPDDRIGLTRLADLEILASVAAEGVCPAGGNGTRSHFTANRIVRWAVVFGSVASMVSKYAPDANEATGIDT